MGKPTKAKASPEVQAGGELTAKQRRFVELYCGEARFNATEAARLAGYKGNDATLGSVGGENLQKPEIAAAIAAFMGEHSAKAGLTVERIAHEIAVLAFSDVRHFTVNDAGRLELAAGAPDEAWRSVASVKHRVTTTKNGDKVREVEYRLWSKTDALQMGGKHLGMFLDRLANPDGSELKAPVVNVTVRRTK